MDEERRLLEELLEASREILRERLAGDITDESLVSLSGIVLEVEAIRTQRKLDRRGRALDEMVSLSEELGLYDNHEMDGEER